MKKKKIVIDKHMEHVEKLSKMCETANKSGGNVAWSGERTKDGGFVMRVNIPIK